MARRSDSAFARNREKQRARNAVSNPRRTRTESVADKTVRLSARPFIGWDGEGYDLDTGKHCYMLFGASTGEYITGRDLGTIECLDLILFVESQNPTAFHVGFAFEYDVNMILKDLETRFLAVLHDAGSVIWNGYRIKHVPHKTFTVSKNGVSATIYDVFGFFHQSYLSALGKFGLGGDASFDKVKEGKAARGQFTYEDIDFVIDYWKHEIAYFPLLMDKLRESCYDAGFLITQWHGPGALASFVLRNNGVKEWHGKDVPKPVQVARRLAYAGGRFQCWKCGFYPMPVYTADINSAYAYACSMLPRLDNGHWVKRNPAEIRKSNDIAHFGLYRIAFDARERKQRKDTPYPLFNRDKQGNLTWPPFTENWYWSPEAALVAGSPSATFLECWEYIDDGTRPFSFVESAFERRLVLQYEGNYAEKAYKWFLASIYGQFAQRVGWNKKKRTAPPSHCLEWAGYITSYCRALVYRAAVDVARRGGLISIDTDGVTSTVPFNPEKLPGGTGDKLGQWKLEQFTGLIYWQNGIYWLRNEQGEWKEPKTRGIPKGSMSAYVALMAYHHVSRHERVSKRASFTIRRTRFTGYRLGLRNQMESWRTWKQETATVKFGGSGKGRHIPVMCHQCCSPQANTLHDITHLWSETSVSNPHFLPWLENTVPAEYLGVDRNTENLGIWEDETL